jgi:2-polyprenyl-3-methyl-5-hydroxy-6-metoxy-1,4-benzoquinol methylase
MKYAPKIAFMTTLGVNVGDEFIREGIFSFLDDIFKNWEPYYVNKHDLTTLHRHCEDETMIMDDKFRDADIIVQSGAPVYWQLGSSTCYNVEWAEALWENRIFRLGPEKPVLNIAAGACQPYPDYAKSFLADPLCVQFARKAGYASRWTSVRDPLASQILYALGIKHEVLPCSAFHAARRTNFRGGFDQVVGVNLMPKGGHFKLRQDLNECDWKQKIGSLLTHLRKRHRLVFIAHDTDEKAFMEQFLVSGEVVFHSAKFRDYLHVYSKCCGVISNRVHAAICAAGFLRPSVILGNDTRLLIADYIDIPSRYIDDVAVEEIVDLFEYGLAHEDEERERLMSLREKTAARYSTCILAALDNCSEKIPRHSSPSKKFQPLLSLASLSEISSSAYQDFIKTLNCFAKRLGLFQIHDCAKVWVIPWLWFNGLCTVDWMQMKVLDTHSELGSMPWFLASLGAGVTLTSRSSVWVNSWQRILKENDLDIQWAVSNSERITLPKNKFDVVTCFSGIEHHPNKNLAINEAIRVLKPGGIFALSFDICEPDKGMLYPDWKGSAWRIKEFEKLVWQHPKLDNGGKRAEWNVEDCGRFIRWHQKYVTGASILKKV